MFQPNDRCGRAGFSLIEALLMLILASLLAAAVFPVMTREVEVEDAAGRAHRDLTDLRLAMERFHFHVPRAYPGDLEDLLAPITPADAGLTANDLALPFTDHDGSRWKGPYADSLRFQPGAVSGYGLPIRNRFVRYDATHDAPFGSPDFRGTGTSLFVAVRLGSREHPISVAEFEAINDLVDGADEPDGPGEGTSWTRGRLRLNNLALPEDTVAYYLAASLKR